MTDNSRLGPWVRRFLLEHLIKERNLSRGTQQSYRDTLTLLIPFVARKTRKSVDALGVVHVSADLVRMFLLHLEESRGCAISTRNQRLAAIRSLARFVALHSPERRQPQEHARAARSSSSLVPVQHRHPRGRSRPGSDRGSQPRPRPQPGLFVGKDTWKRQ
jgi:site-specific recombinase XerD